MSEIPLGQKESQRLEFKGQGALKDHYRIGREVVAMLNAEGGEVWIGLGEEESRAVKVEPVENAEMERGMLRDFLMDSIEPSPSSSEIGVSVEEAGEGQKVLRVEVREAERKPYALLKQGGRWFVTRVGDRLRPMGREEILESASAGRGAKEELPAIFKKISERRTAEFESAEKGYWLHLVPVPAIELDIQSDVFARIIEEPTIIEVRRGGRNFAQATCSRPSVSEKGVTWSSALAGGRWRRKTVIAPKGSLTCSTTLSDLQWGDRHPPEIHPLRLLELTTSAFRLARFLYRELGDRPPRKDGRLVADLALAGLRGCRLPPGSPKTEPWEMEEPAEYQDSDDLVWEDPLVFWLEEVIDEPDRCGFRVIRRVYEAFGFYEDAIPEEFDRKTGRLVLPE